MGSNKMGCSMITSTVAVVVYSLCGLVVTCAGLFPAGGNGAALQPNFYGATCPQAETIVRQEVIKGLHTDIGFAAGLVRMHFHDCFVRGCDASILLESTPDNTAERDSPVNNPSLRGFEVIDSAKARLEDACPGVVSCADITSSCMTVYIDAGLALSSGAHTIGRSHGTAFSDRLYNFSATAAPDPALDAAFLAQLRHACPATTTGAAAVDPGLVVPVEPRTPYALDTLYYWGVLRGRGLFVSDQALLASAPTAAQVRQAAYGSYPWKLKFAAAMVKMGQIQVLTGGSGQIRAKCGAVN